MTSPADPVRSSLQDQLDEITANTRALVPAESLAGTEHLVKHLQTSGLTEHLLPAGSAIPSFTLQGANGKKVHSPDLLALGPLVVKFFRGRWDPYDMTELQAWQALQPALRQRRALLVAISPQTPRQNAFTVERHGFTFPVLSDPGCTVARAFDLVYTVPEPSQRYFRSMMVNLPLMNGDSSWQLPLPATYLASAAGDVLLAQAFADHRVRPEPDAVLTALDRSGLSLTDGR